MTWSRLTDAIPDFDNADADGFESVGDQDGFVADGATDGFVVSMGGPWRRITKGNNATLDQITVPISSFTRLTKGNNATLDQITVPISSFTRL
mgnify:CR=1 FL=1